MRKFYYSFSLKIRTSFNEELVFKFVLITMLSRAIVSLVVFTVIHSVQSFLTSRLSGRRSFTSHRSTVADSGSNTWQQDLDQILDVDTDCDSRQELAKGLLSKAADIATDVSTAIQDKDTTKIAPTSLGYGKAFVEFQKFQKQLLTDIIPDILTRGVPKLVDEAPELFSQISSQGPEGLEGLAKKGQELLSTVQDLTQDASLLQSTVDDLTNELKNVVKSTPIGLEMPLYEIVKAAGGDHAYEIRNYSPYSVAYSAVESEDDMMEPIASGKSFQTLAGYIFGDNNADETMSMTTPVITEADSKSMYFVLPKTMSSETAPIPKSGAVMLKDMQADAVATMQFSGIATEGEVNRQKALLEDALLLDGIMYDSATFKVLQYNPPQTLPWLRRNEVAFSVTMPQSEEVQEVEETAAEAVEGAADGAASTFDKAGAVPDDEDTFFSSPEAGD